VSPSERAACTVEVLSVRVEPNEAAEQVTQLLRGEPVSVAERRRGWARILTAYDYPGWARGESLRTAPSPPGWPPRPPRPDTPLACARGYLGAPYEWGGMSGRGIDCSGLVHMAYRLTGRLVPRDAHQQEAAGVPLGEAEVRAGDLVTYGESSAEHIAFWSGEGRILHATGRAGIAAVVEEAQPPELAAVLRRYVRL
jgi:gamma-D-glutamyl-L-lysine dipeptidyl-peptidase